MALIFSFSSCISDDDSGKPNSNTPIDTLNSNTPKVGQVALIFNIKANNEPLALETGEYYTNQQDTFSVKKMRFYISGVTFQGDADAYKVPDSYHLVQASRSSATDTVWVEMPAGTYSRTSFGLGVDSIGNASEEAARGDLDPSSDMTWNWTKGYKFLSIEGNIINRQQAGQLQGLIIHMGENKNYRTYTFDQNFTVDAEGKRYINIDVETTALFNSPKPVSFADNSVFMFAAAADTIYQNAGEGFITFKDIK